MNNYPGRSKVQCPHFAQGLLIGHPKEQLLHCLFDKDFIDEESSGLEKGKEDRELLTDCLIPAIKESFAVSLIKNYCYSRV